MSKKIISSAIFVSLFCSANFALADILNPLGNSNSTFCSLLTSIAAQVGSLVAILGTIMLIVAGILYLTSAGNPTKTETAKKALIYAIIGIFIGVAASSIVSIVKNILGASGGC